MTKQSAGILLYRFVDDSLQVFLVHPGGPFWRNKDDGSWSIPKGELDDTEDALAAAKREFWEETGLSVDGAFIELHPIQQKAGKTVKAWALEGDIDAGKIVSNLFTIEWPPRSGRMADFPEVDKAAWFTPDEARIKINAAQIPLIGQLASIVNKTL